MKLTAGLGCIDDYEAYAEAGADELFAGYVPEDWMTRFGTRAPINRREVLMCNVQLGAMSELMILRDMIHTIRVPVTLAFNFPAYTTAQRDAVIGIARRCAALGFRDVIAADDALIRALAREGLHVHVSGEYGELNRFAVQRLADMGVRRVIFPRQTTVSEMRAMIAAVPTLEYEAFVLNERCHFTGAYCASLHTDALCHMCRVPYRMSSGKPLCHNAEKDIPGGSGCGLCALRELEEAGVTHMKLVSRGADTERTVRDIRALRVAHGLAKTCASADDYRTQMKATLFPNGCGESCYYPEGEDHV